MGSAIPAMKFYAKCVQLVLGLLLANTAAAQWDVPADSSFELGGGSINLACLPVTVAGTYDLGNGQATGAGGLEVQAGGVFNAQGQLQLGADFANQGVFNAGTGSVIMDGSCTAASTVSISGQATFSNLTLSSTSGQTYMFQAGADILVTGTLTIQGLPGQPVQLASANGSPVVIRLAPGAQIVQTNATLTQVHLGSVPVATTSIPTLGHAATLLLSLLLLGLAHRQRKYR